MDTISLYYFKELTKDLHMTKTAERLYISQQTLSNHILRLEKQLGCQLFYRKPALTLTYTGKQVLSFAEQILSTQNNLHDLLIDIENNQRGEIRFGASTLRMNAALPRILPEFSKMYPHVEIKITDAKSNVLEPLIVSGELDYAIVAMKSKKDMEAESDSLIYDYLISDQLYLCVSDELLIEHFGDKAEELKQKSKNGAHVADFKDLPFIVFENRLGKLIQNCFTEAGFQPQVYISAPSSQVVTSVGLSGISAFFSTRVILSTKKNEIPDNINIFPLLYKDKFLYQHISLVRHKNRYLAQHSVYFLDLIKKCFSDIEHTDAEYLPQF